MMIAMKRAMVNRRVRLHIECKYIARPVVFWFDARDAAKAVDAVKRATPLKENYRFTHETHHYLVSDNQFVAKLFASAPGKFEENEPIFRALNQCLNGFVNNRNGSALISTKNSQECATIEYPLIVCSRFDSFYRTDVKAGGAPTRISRNFLLEVNYAYVVRTQANKREYFLIDVVEYDQLTTWMDAPHAEIELAKQMLQT